MSNIVGSLIGPEPDCQSAQLPASGRSGGGKMGELRLSANLNSQHKKGFDE